MRHLYRGKAKRVEGREYVTNYKNGDWVYGLVADINETYGIAKMTNEQGVFGIEVDSKTIGQYIGINDINDKKIFEGDIVKGIAYFLEWTGVIVWIKEIASFGLYHGHDIACENCSILKRASSGMKDEFTAEIIGNIYDNPELLKKVN